MSAEILDFPFHRVKTEYSEGPSVRFGNNWVFTAKPDAADQRVFTLDFSSGMQYFIVDLFTPARHDVQTPQGLILSGQRPRTVVLDVNGDPVEPNEEERIGQRNILALQHFYERHRQWDTFMYPHVIDGMLKVRFNKPLSTPRVVVNGNGVVEAFSLELLEMF